MRGKAAGMQEMKQGGVVPLKIRDTEFMGSQCSQLEQSSEGSLVP